MTGLLAWAFGCAESSVTLAPVTGQVAWMQPEYRGHVTIDVEASEVPVGVLRRHTLAEDGTFAFDDLPVGEVYLDVYVRVGTWACDNTVWGTLDVDGLHVVFESWESCYDTGFE